MILSITLNAAVDHTLIIEGLKPHDTNRIQEVQTDAGGKGINLSRIVHELGGETLASGFLGGNTGDYVEHRLTKDGVPHQFVRTKESTRTNFNIESGDGPPTTLNAPGPRVSAAEFSDFANLYRNLCKKAEWVALGGAIPPGLPTDIFAVLVRYAHEQKCRVALDADGEAMACGLECGPDLIKPNLAEAMRLLGREIDEDVVRQAADELNERQRRSGAVEPICIISMGAKGAIAVQSHRAVRADPIEVEVKSTIGSGDSLVGGFLCSWTEHSDLSEALRLGNAAGAATALTDGSDIGRRDMILALREKSHVRSLD